MLQEKQMGETVYILETSIFVILPICYAFLFCYACTVPRLKLSAQFLSAAFLKFRLNCYLYMTQWDRKTCPRAIMCDNSDNVLRFRHILDGLSLNSGPPKLATWPCISFILWELKQESMEYVEAICWGKAPRAQLLKKSAFLFLLTRLNLLNKIVVVRMLVCKMGVVLRAQLVFEQ